MKRLDLINLLEEACGDRCNPEYNPCAYKEAARELRELEPFIYMYEVNQTYTQLCKELPPDDAYDEGTLVPLYALGDEK